MIKYLLEIKINNLNLKINKILGTKKKSKERKESNNYKLIKKIKILRIIDKQEENISVKFRSKVLMIITLKKG